MRVSACKYYLDENAPGYVVEYRGDFKAQMEKVDYACGDVITDTLAVVAVNEDNLDMLRKDVPAIIFIEARSVYTLQDISPSDVGNIYQIKSNPYLGLNGKDVLVGIIDTGVNYLNREFVREDDTSRIISLWDQSIESYGEPGLYIGRTYSNEEINTAIKAQKNGQDPYAIVPSKDDVGHGTKMAGIIGARGYNGKMVGIANNCDFLVVKLFESPNYKMILRKNNLPIVPVYNSSEVLAAIAYLERKAQELERPIVIYLGVGSTQGSHDGYNITARFITSIANKSGVIFVAGTGNLGNSEGHVTKYIKNVGDIDTVELRIPRTIELFEFYIWVQKPNRMSLSIVSPSGDEIGFFPSKVILNEKRKFYLSNTEIEVKGYDPENFTGHQVYNLKFKSIKAGIWKLKLQGDYIINGRYDIWLQDKNLLPEGTKFLEPNPLNTLTIPATARKVITVSYFGELTKTILAESGKGFNTNYLINPDISTVGTNVLTISPDGNSTVTDSGSSVATAIVAGVCALLLQWAVVDENDITINSTKMRSLLIYAAKRERNVSYPNEESGYGELNFAEVFNVLSGNYRSIRDKYEEYYVNNMYIRVPKNTLIKERRK